MKVMVAVIVAISLILTLVIALLAQGKPSVKENKEAVDLVGIINESFTEKNTESAMTEQQVELESLKEQISNMTKKFDYYTGKIADIMKLTRKTKKFHKK